MPIHKRYIILRCLLFVGIFIMIVILLDARLDAMYPDHNAYQFRELLHSTEPADVITLGSSTAVHGYVPAILQTLSGSHCDFKRTFNFGYIGAQPPFYLQWYRLLFKHYYHPPALVIVSLDWFSAGANHGDPQREQVALTQDSRYLPWAVLSKLFWQADAHGKTMLLMNMVRIMHAGPDVRYFFIPRNDPAMAGYDRGYAPLDGTIDLTQEGDREFSVNDSFLHDLSSLLDEIRSHGSQAILVQMPVYNPETIHNIQESRVFADMADSHNIPYLDYNGDQISSLNSQTSLFADWSHLNRKGSEVFTEKIRDDLQRLIENQKGTLCH